MASIESIRTQITGKGIPLPGDDIDTDRIIPARYLREITFETLGQYALHDVVHHLEEVTGDLAMPVS